ncbi:MULTISPECIES: HPr family phosphocarrier protein [unclassified Marinobacterium]|jgi:phosphocarrier protein HPr|uniref:HPr family phosphocarrier protein n=1 Tax=unclassified Marinobacterium TaxID=2644139 RepID=UPI0015680D53|nr:MULTISPECIES: HPr family phosphocarrier protein [unclassified Marinobacterium]NRP15995.1 Phosphocarrier protein HPr [Marinobacterium sp. xm-a-152]NRP35449.1 Phosphocarrier protein HPr [Marinobacterium sp. xm-d-579]NRP37813.1 Phosphocarrier protein HPr [Marinobacterium sp. xm-a-121]NRP46254.1 Phosphocarrier protein HPr [Marinobacterium sp. xm-d-543]NRP52768.1 Phosphocarrier protein HPr [Marinobacterium sp. xm-v-242]
MIEKNVTIINKLGLHARAAAKLIGVTGKFGCDIKITKDGKTVDAKSIMAIMMLAASQGTDLIIQTDGADESAAMDAVIEIINNRFDEDE